MLQSINAKLQQTMNNQSLIKGVFLVSKVLCFVIAVFVGGYLALNWFIPFLLTFGIQ